MRLQLGKLDLFIKLLEMEGFAADLEFDRGKATKYGVSSRAWPDDYARLSQAQWNLDDVFLFYNEHFMKDIASFDELLYIEPGLAAILFMGKVHGVGINHYTLVLQQALNPSSNLLEDGVWGPKTAEAVISGLTAGRLDPLEVLRDNRDDLIARRIKAVGAYPRGIRNRVNDEFAFAMQRDRSKLFKLAA